MLRAPGENSGPPANRPRAPVLQLENRHQPCRRQSGAAHIRHKAEK